MGDGDGVVRELLEELKAMRAEVRELRAERRGPQSSGKTLRQIYEIDEATWSHQSWAVHLRGALGPALKYFGDRVADEITRAEWLHYRDSVRAKQETLRKRPPTPSTLNQETKRWRTVYRRALETGLVTTNPLVGIRAVRGAKVHRETEPTEDDREAIRRNCDALTYAFYLLGFRRGFRASEARRLEWKQVDLDHATITLYAWQEKTRRARTMRITSDLVDALRAIKPDVPGRYVFPGRDGGPMHATTMWRRVRMAIDAAGCTAAEGDDRMTQHDQRHRFVSAAVRRSGVMVAMRLARHRSLNAAARYIHIDDKDLEHAYEQMEDEVRHGPKQSPPESDDVEHRNRPGEKAE